MRLIFMGTPEFAIPSLEKLHQSHHELVGIVTGPDKPVGRGQKLAATPVKRAALDWGIPLLTPSRLADASFLSALQALRADLIVVVAFRILPMAILTMPRRGAINLHASLLPKYRGAAPINWAIMNGETETGVTTFFIEEKVDTGNWILQRKVSIGAAETAGELHDRLCQLGAGVLLETVDLIQQDQAPKIPQVGEITKAPRLTSETCRIDWAKDGAAIYNQIRGLAPFPRAFTHFKDKEIKILKSELAPAEKYESKQPGIVLAVEKERIVVATGNGALAISEVQPENKRRMTVAEYLRGHAVVVGDQFHQ